MYIHISAANRLISVNFGARTDAYFYLDSDEHHVTKCKMSQIHYGDGRRIENNFLPITERQIFRLRRKLSGESHADAGDMT